MEERTAHLGFPVFFVFVAPALSRPAVLRALFAGRSSVGSGALGSSIAVASGTGSPLPGLAVLPAEPRATFFFALASVFAPDPAPVSRWSSLP